jgi:hypothetical protein
VVTQWGMFTQLLWRLTQTAVPGGGYRAAPAVDGARGRQERDLSSTGQGEAPAGMAAGAPLGTRARGGKGKPGLLVCRYNDGTRGMVPRLLQCLCRCKGASSRHDPNNAQHKSISDSLQARLMRNSRDEPLRSALT